MLDVVAILDDDEQLLTQLGERLAAANLSPKTFTSRRDFKQSIERGDRYDALILDWYLEDPESSTIAKLVLDDLRRLYFLPVVIYTDQRDVAEGEIPQLQRPFNRCQLFDKDTTDPETLTNQLATWYAQSMPARLCEVWRNARRRSLEAAIYELDALEGEDFYRTLRHILIMDSGEIADVDHALEFLERFVERKVLSDATLRDTLRAELNEAIGPELQAQGNRELALVNAHRYVMPPDQLARTGDIVQVLDVGAEPLMTAVVITPACDLEQRKCFELRLVKADERQQDSRRASECELPAVRVDVGGAYRDFVVDFHKTIFVHDVSIAADPKGRRSRLISYEDEFQDVFGKRLWLKVLCRLDDPYRSDLLQRYSSHASRIGIPE